MAVPKNLVWEQSSGTGTGNKTLVRYGGFARVSEAFGTGDAGSANPILFFSNKDATSAEWEVVQGYMSDANTFVPVTRLDSSNGGSAVNFTAGLKFVTCDVPAQLQVYIDSNAASPPTNDGAALGKAGTAWSDLYLASGGVLDWNNGNFTLTHLNAVGLEVAGGHIYLADTNPTVNNVAGWSLRPNGVIACSSDGGSAFEINRKTSDGGLVNLRQDGTLEGQISVSGTTVTYGSFCGSHWARFADDAYIGILPGTILEAIEGVVRWKFATFDVDDVTVTVAYNGPAQHGDSVELDFAGDTYTALVTDEEPGNTLVKHVRVKVSDTANSSAVYGVFISYGKDDGWNDVHVAALGNYFVRMAAGQTPQIGDLVVSDGTGCGMVQDDGVIRSKTVAKVTNAIPQHFYDDGSYLVPCVMYCG